MGKGEKQKQDDAFAEATEKGKMLGLAAAAEIFRSFDSPFMRKLAATSVGHEVKQAILSANDGDPT